VDSRCIAYSRINNKLRIYRRGSPTYSPGIIGKVVGIIVTPDIWVKGFVFVLVGIQHYFQTNYLQMIAFYLSLAPCLLVKFLDSISIKSETPTTTVVIHQCCYCYLLTQEMFAHVCFVMFKCLYSFQEMMYIKQLQISSVIVIFITFFPDALCKMFSFLC